MTIETRPANVLTLREVLGSATASGFGVGSFAARYTPMVRPILRGAQRTQSPAIVQISQKELARYGIGPAEVSSQFYDVLRNEGITVPVVLHLDHTRQIDIIHEAISAGFTSVMIDASEMPFAENAATIREIVEYAHPRSVSVEAELGRIGTTDFVETEHDEEMYTDPDEAAQFVDMTGVDALAVSVGTAHGVYNVRQPKIDFGRLSAIRELTHVPLVLHGGSGVPSEMMQHAIRLPGGGVSKVNIATDLELAWLEALGREERMTNEEAMSLSPEDLRRAQHAVERTVVEKIQNFVVSEGRAADIRG
ncbi:MAG TPA: class II fructose-bisphosphate aldolase [Chloroflexota bacterium]